MIVDGHLDLTFNALYKGRDLTLPLDALRRREARHSKEAMVTLPELASAGIGIVFATVFVLPNRHADTPGPWTYEDEAGASTLAHAHLDQYERWEQDGWIRILRTRDDLESHLAALADRGVSVGGEKSQAGVEEARLGEASAPPTGVVLLMEGAAPILDPCYLGEWVARGVRMVGPAWKANRYAGGTGEPGPLTDAGAELIDAMGEHGLVLDVSHLAEASFWPAVERHRGAVIASHSNARALVDTDRQLSDAMLRELATREAVVGLVLADKFLRRPPHGDRVAVTLADVRRHAEHMAAFVGWSSLGIGSDFDGGFGRQETPKELDRARDFPRLGEVVPSEHRASFMGGAWVSLLRRALPSD